MDPSAAVDMMLVVMTYGDTATGNVLTQAMGIISDAYRVSQTTRNFIHRHFYVDDGGLSSQSKSVVEKVTSELEETFTRYMFHIKHIIRTWTA
jgi:hypothetical protein